MKASVRPGVALVVRWSVIQVKEFVRLAVAQVALLFLALAKESVKQVMVQAAH